MSPQREIMKAWRLHDKEVLTFDDLPVQNVGDGCVKLKTLVSGISQTDVLMYSGKIPLKAVPLIIGRQCVGMVTEVGENVSRLQRGDRVVVDPFAACGICPQCKAEQYDECEKLICRGVDDNGFMSDFNVLPANLLYKLPDRIKDNDAILIEHIALSINVVNKLNLEKGEHLVIVGASTLGIILAQVAIYYQAVPVLVDTDAQNLALAADLGVYYTVNSVDADPAKKIFAITGGKMAEAVAFVNTAQMAFGRSLDYAARGGRVALVGWAEVSDEISGGLGAILDKQLKLVGVNNGAHMYSSAINLLANRTLDVSRLISHEIKFDDVAASVREHMENPALFMKAVVKV